MEFLFSLLYPLTILAVAGSGLMSGLFFVFSFCVMQALAQMPSNEGMKAMQLINRTILNPVFLSAFAGTAIACLLVAVLSLWQQQAGFWSLAGAIVYLVGGFGVTAACNVPLNKALDVLPPDSAESHIVWRDYLNSWTRWNHVRTVACIVATVLLAHGLGASLD